MTDPSSDSLPVLPIQNMAERHYGLTSSIAESYLEAARVCLDQHHTSPKEFTLEDDERELMAQVVWEVADDRIKAACANINDATEAGAYACALATTELLQGMVAIRRAETRTGADYYIAPADEDFEDLENCLRLEVSGTHLEKSEVKRRLSQKIQQAKNGKSNLPALAIVVGFKVRLILLREVDEAS